MLGKLIIGEEAAREQAEAAIVGTELGSLIITAEDRANATRAAGIAPPVAPAEAAPTIDDAMGVREIVKLLGETPEQVQAVVTAEGGRVARGLEIRTSVLKACVIAARKTGNERLEHELTQALAQLEG